MEQWAKDWWPVLLALITVVGFVIAVERWLAERKARRRQRAAELRVFYDALKTWDQWMRNVEVWLLYAKSHNLENAVLPQGDVPSMRMYFASYLPHRLPTWDAAHDVFQGAMIALFNHVRPYALEGKPLSIAEFFQGLDRLIPAVDEAMASYRKVAAIAEKELIREISLPKSA